MSSKPRPPDLVNPVTGDRLWFDRVPVALADALVFRCEIPAGSRGTPMHLHLSLDERFEVLEGELAMCIGSKRGERRLQPGEAVDVPRRLPHRFWNASDAPALFRSTVTPGGDFCRFIRTVYGLGADGLAGADGMPRNILQIAAIRDLSDLYFDGAPLWLQRPAFAVLSAVATLSGTRRSLARYWADSRRVAPEGGQA
jgi:mannose-6-phosphate isomerase-like protein (cupin superfamily)